MANIRLIRNRIKSAQNIAQITKAMEMVAASKMKRAQNAAISGRLYAGKIYEMVMFLASKVDYTNHPLLTRPSGISGKRLVVLISTNKGLTGGLNTNLFRFTLSSYRDNGQQDYITLGKKGADFAVRLGKEIVADFSTGTSFSGVVPALTEMITEKYLSGAYDGIDLVYSEFISAINQRPKKKTILPLTLEALPEQKQAHFAEFLVEPDVERVFNSLLPHYLENQIRDAVLQAEASEHSARMMAMRNATDNAMSLVGDLTLLYNKVRQEKITYEITDMITARLASEG
jgi:F-type H+-transporting ATPase subunit gamma